MVLDKIASQAAAARHYQRQCRHDARRTLEDLRRLEHQARAAAALPQLRGYEGVASNAWFGLLAKLLKSPWTFPRRVRRPPTDAVNALLSLGYTWLAARVQGGIGPAAWKSI